MSGYSPYSAGNQYPNPQYANNDSRQQQPGQGQPGWRPPVATAPSGYQQTPNPQNYGTPSLDGSRGTPMAGTPGIGHATQSQDPAAQSPGYFPPQPQPGMVDQGGMGGLTSQMGQIGMGGEPAAYRAGKKKQRHAYHNLDQSNVAAQAFNQSTGNAAQFVNQDAHQPQSDPSHPYGSQQVTPAMNQFPAQAGAPAPFSPGLGPAGQGFQNQVQNPNIPAPAVSGVSAQGRVDPEQIPSIPRQRDAAAQYYLDHVYPTMEQHLPPPGAVPYVSQDQGNSSPKYARLTLNNIPAFSDALNATGLPLGLVLQPLAPLQAGETPIPVLDFGDVGPPRCPRCRAYINPFMIFRSGGNKLVCNMCTFPNDVSPEYFAPTDPTGTRVDRAQRPELTTGTVEYLVPKEYWAKKPVGLRWLFVIDVSQDAVDKGFLGAFCEGILKTLYGDASEDDSDTNGVNGDAQINRTIPIGAKVGFITYDKAMHYYNCNVSLPSFWRSGRS